MLENYHDNANGDLWLTLIYFMHRRRKVLNIGGQGSEYGGGGGGGEAVGVNFSLVVS